MTVTDVIYGELLNGLNPRSPKSMLATGPCWNIVQSRTMIPSSAMGILHLPVRRLRLTAPPILVSRLT